MPTLVRIEDSTATVGGSRSRQADDNNNDESSQDLDETTMSIMSNYSKDKNDSVNPNDETTLAADKSMNLLDHSFSSSEEEDSSDNDSDDDNTNRSNRKAAVSSAKRDGETDSATAIDGSEASTAPISNKGNTTNNKWHPSALSLARVHDNVVDGDNDETRLSDSESSSCDTPLRPKCGSQPSSQKLHSQAAKRSQGYDDSSDSDSSCSTPRPRRQHASQTVTKSTDSPTERRHSKSVSNAPRDDMEQTSARRMPPQLGIAAYKQNFPVEKIEWKQQQESDDFRTQFAKKVSNFERRNPRVRLCDYNALSPDDQRVEQDRVMHLLSRLGIRHCADAPSPSASNRNYNSTVSLSPGDTTLPRDESMTRLDDSHSYHQRQSPHTSIELADEKDSMEKTYLSPKGTCMQSKRSSQEIGTTQRRVDLTLQLSPIAKTSPSQMPLQEEFDIRFSAASPALQGGSPPISLPPCNGDDDSSISDRSVEVTRGAASRLSNSPDNFQSPPIKMMNRSNASKRNASASGKRGNDKCRTRLNHDSSLDSSMDEVMRPCSQNWQSSDDSVSLVSAGEDRPNNPFSASQSPITESTAAKRRGSRSQQQQREEDHHSYRGGSHCHSSTQSQRQKSYRDQDSRFYNDETINSVDATIRCDRPGRDRLREISTNVALKDGVPFHYNPLHIKRSKRSKQKERAQEGDNPRQRFSEFRDPLGMYFGEESEDLHSVFDWVLGRDNAIFTKWSLESKGIIFSLNNTQIRNVAIKTLMEADVQSTRGEDRYGGDSSVSGQTLIVVRNKEDIASWERSLRELTPFSVISHADLPASERKRSATAARCATFDIVISTYDAIKSQDVTVQLDEFGHAVARQNVESQASGGWMTKRNGTSSGSSQRAGATSQQLLSGDPVKCKPLSVLHNVKWRRIIFGDKLGRKCFLAKLGTARASAARALNGDARFIFFADPDEECEESAFESLQKSDKTAIQSVAAALRIETDNAEGDLLDVIIDPAEGILS